MKIKPTYKKPEALLILVLIGFLMSNVMPCLTFYAEAEVVYDSSDSDKKDKKEKEEDTKDKIRATLNNKDYYLILSRSMALNLSSYFAPLLEIITPPPEHIS